MSLADSDEGASSSGQEPVARNEDARAITSSLDLTSERALPERLKDQVRAALRRMTRGSLARALGLASVLGVVFVAVDYVVAPAQFLRFALYKLAAIVVFLGTWHAIQRASGRKHPQAMLLLAAAAGAIAVQLTVLDSGGHHSPYYVGHVLVGLVAVGFVPASRAVHLLALSLIYATYLVPILVLDPITDLGSFSLANAHLLASFGVMWGVRTIHMRRLEREIALGLELHDHSAHVDRKVDARTRGLLASVEGLTRDLEEMSRREASLRKDLLEWEASFDAIGDAITIQDADLNIVSANRAARELLQIDGAPASALKCFRRVHGTDQPIANCPSCGMFQTGRVGAIEYYEPHLGRYLHVTAFPRRDPEGEISHVVHVLRDVTSERQADAARKAKDLHGAYVRRMEALGRLATGVALDFGELLRTMRASADAAKEETRLVPVEAGILETIQRQLENIERATVRGQEVVDDLLAFGQAQTLDPRALTLKEVIAGFATKLERLAGPGFQIDFDFRSVRTVMADPRQLEVALCVLVENAREAMPTGGRLSIEVFDGELRQTDPSTGRPPGSYVIVNVRDTGVGMRPDVKERVFEPFFTTKPSGQGVGLSLPMVHGIVGQHGGHIEVASVEGRGTEFSLWFPATTHRPEASASPVILVEAGRGGNVLVVENDGAVRLLVAALLQTLGYHCLVAEGPQQALEMVRADEAPVDLLVTEQEMSSMDGPTLAALVRQRSPKTRVLYMTNRRGVDGGVDGIGNAALPIVTPCDGAIEGLALVKPFTASELARRVRETMSLG